MSWYVHGGTLTAPTIGAPSALSAFCWYKTFGEDPTFSGNSLFGNWGGNSPNYNFLLSVGRGSADFNTLDGAASGHSATVNEAKQVGRWNAIGCTFESGTPGTQFVYHNGARVRGTPWNGGLHSNANTTRIGGRSDNLVPLNGLIARAAIWTVALNSDEMMYLQRGGDPLQIRRGLWAYWSLDGQGGTQDLSGNQRHLAVSGLATPYNESPIFVPRRNLPAVPDVPSRISQEAVEVIYTGAPTGRVSQESIETLLAGDAAARISQDAIEVLRVGAVTTQAGISQVAIEALLPNPPSRLSQVAVEVIGSSVVTFGGRLSQVAVEALRKTYVTGTGRGNGGEMFCLQLAPNGTSESATLVTAMSAITTTITLSGDGALPSSAPFCLTIDGEVVYVTPLGEGVYRILHRALSGTSASSHTAGTTVSWDDTYLMAIVAEVGIGADFFNADDELTYPGWLMSLDSSQAHLGGDRYAMHVAELVGVYDPSDVGGASRLDGAQPNAICVPAEVTENCPSAMSVPARIDTDIEIGDVALVRYTNPEASVLELCSRSCALQAWYGFKRVDDTDNDVTFDPPDPPFGSGGSHVVDVLPLDATPDIHGAQEGFHNEPFVTTTLAGSDRYFTYGTPYYSEKGWPIAALAVRQGKRRIPRWTSPDWHNFLYVYSGFGDDATYVQIVVNRNGLLFGPEPTVNLPGPQDIDGPNATWDDSSYYSAVAWNVVIFAGAYILIGPVLNPGGDASVPIDAGSPVGIVGPSGDGQPFQPPSPVVEGGEGGGIEPPFPEAPAVGLVFQTEAIAIPFVPPHIEVDHT